MQHENGTLAHRLDLHVALSANLHSGILFRSCFHGATVLNNFVCKKQTCLGLWRLAHLHDCRRFHRDKLLYV